jgi:hypothetical protein
MQQLAPLLRLGPGKKRLRFCSKNVSHGHVTHVTLTKTPKIFYHIMTLMCCYVLICQGKNASIAGQHNFCRTGQGNKTWQSSDPMTKAPAAGPVPGIARFWIILDDIGYSEA